MCSNFKMIILIVKCARALNKLNRSRIECIRENLNVLFNLARISCCRYQFDVDKTVENTV